MKLTSVTAGVGFAAAAVLSGNALALNPADVGSADVVLKISGASAQQKTLGKILAEFCAGDLHTYQDKPSSGSAGKKWRNYFCTIKTEAAGVDNIPDVLEGKKLLTYNRSKGGSIWGVVPVARAWQVEYLNIGSNCSLSAGDTTAGTYDCTWDTDRSADLVAGPDDQECPQSSADILNPDLTSSTFCARSDGGVSDVEPALFVGDNLPGGWTQLSLAETAVIPPLSEYGVVFGISVTHDVYRELQQAQGLIGAADPVDLDPAKQPSMKKTEVQSILGGGIKNWKSLDQSFDGIGASGLGFMNVCRRVVGSGTQAAQNAQFMGTPCLSGENGGKLKMVTAADSGFTYKVVENSGSGDVIDCQNDAFTGTSFGFALGAIGFNAIEKQPKAGDNWAYVAIDGIAPTRENAISGAYQHWYEQTFQYRTAAVDGVLAPAGNVKTAMDMIVANSGDPAFQTAAGLLGVAALPTNGFDWQNLAGDPVMRGSRGGNSCQPIVLEPAL